MTEQADTTTTGPNGLRRERTHGFLALALGIVALSGGGVLVNAASWWTMDMASSYGDGDLSMAVATSGPIVVLAVAAAWLGMSAAESADDTAVAAGRSGLVLAGLAIVGALFLALSVMTRI